MTVSNRFQARNVNRTTQDTENTETNTVVKGNNKTVKRRDRGKEERNSSQHGGKLKEIKLSWH